MAIHEDILNIVTEMHDDAEKLDDDSMKSMMEGHCDHYIAERLRLYANKIMVTVAQDMSGL